MTQSLLSQKDPISFSLKINNKTSRKGTRVTEERLRQRGYIPFLEHYLKVKYGRKPQLKTRKKK